MKVIFYNHTGQVSGAERVMLMILSGLDQNKFEIFVVCPKEGDLTKLAKEAGIHVKNIEPLEARFTWRPDHLVTYLKSFFSAVVKLRQVMIDANPDLIHANTIRAGLVATTATLGTRIQVIWHLHDILPRHPLSTLIRWYAALSSRTELLAVSRAVSRRFRGIWMRLFNSCRKIQVIHNGIDLKRFSNDSTLGQDVRNELGLTDEQFVIGIVGQITPRKGQLGLIRAFANTLPQIPQAVLVIAGAPLFNNDHEYLLELKRAAIELGVAKRIIFTGVRQDMPAVMRALDLLVLNSSVEPLGLVVLEAMACGTSVLGTAVDGVPELIADGVTGWLIPSGNERLLTEKLITLGCNVELRNSLAESAKHNMVLEFSAEKYLKLIEAYYWQVCKPSNVKADRRLAIES